MYFVFIIVSYIVSGFLWKGKGRTPFLTNLSKLDSDFSVTNLELLNDTDTAITMVYLSFRTKPSGACRMRRISRRNQSALATMRGQGRGQSIVFYNIYIYIMLLYVTYMYIYIIIEIRNLPGPTFLNGTPKFFETWPCFKRLSSWCWMSK